MFKVAILGASGYTGVELVRLISMHPEFEIHFLSGETKSGLKFGEVYPSLQYLNLPKLCYDEHCCSKGLVYDKHIGKCVIPSKNTQHHNKKHHNKKHS